LSLFDINDDLEDQMFRVLAAVLHCGNITFKGAGEGCEIENAESRS
jgi:myosin heavy subunit